MKKVLYIVNDDVHYGGATLSLLNLLHAVRDSISPVVLCRAPGEASRLFEERGIPVFILPFQRDYYRGPLWRYPLHAALILWQRRRCVHSARRLFADVSLVHSNSGTVDIGLYIAHALGVPHVWHLREYMDLDFGIRPFLGFGFFRKKLQKSAAVIAVSRGVFDHFALSEHPNARVLYNAVRPASDVSLVLPKENYFLFCAAQISLAKNPLEAIEGLSLSGLQESYRLVMVGRCSPKMQEEMSACANEKGVHWELLPFTENLKPLMSRAAAFLMTSPHEGLGRVTLEAMFEGCPVIGRNSGGTREIIQDGVSGFLYTTPEELGDALRRVVETPMKSMIESAQNLVVQGYSEEVYGGRILAVYKSLEI